MGRFYELYYFFAVEVCKIPYHERILVYILYLCEKFSNMIKYCADFCLKLIFRSLFHLWYETYFDAIVGEDKEVDSLEATLSDIQQTLQLLQQQRVRMNDEERMRNLDHADPDWKQNDDFWKRSEDGCYISCGGLTFFMVCLSAVVFFTSHCNSFTSKFGPYHTWKKDRNSSLSTAEIMYFGLISDLDLST